MTGGGGIRGGIFGKFGGRGGGVNAGISCGVCPRRGCGDDTSLGLTSVRPIFGGEL